MVRILDRMKAPTGSPAGAFAIDAPQTPTWCISMRVGGRRRVSWRRWGGPPPAAPQQGSPGRRQEAPLAPSWRYAAMSAMSFPIASTPLMSVADAPFTPAKNTS